MGDWEVIQKVLKIRASVMWLALVYCFLATLYNVMQKWLERSLTPKQMSLASNFNRAFAGVLSVLYGVESLPVGWWPTLLVLATMGNIGSFSYYNYNSSGASVQGLIEGEDQVGKLCERVKRRGKIRASSSLLLD